MIIIIQGGQQVWDRRMRDVTEFSQRTRGIPGDSVLFHFIAELTGASLP
jgi:hypothetical protein